MRAWRIGGLITLAVIGLAGAASAQHLTLSLGAGGFRPSDAAVRRIYGNGTAYGGDAWLAVKKHIGFAVGFSQLADDGLAVPIGGGEAAYLLSFRRTTVPVLLFYQTGVKFITVRLAAGAGLHSYRETWDTVGLEFKDRKIGPRFALSVSAAVLGRLSLFASATYDSIATGAGSALAPDINLGGFQVQGGLAFRVFQEDP